MRKIIFTSFIIFLFSLSCRKNAEPSINSFSSINEIPKDKIFQQLLLNIQRQVSYIKDVNLLNKYFSDGSLTNDEMQNIHTAFGYHDKQSMLSYFSQLQEQVNYLNKKYTISSLTDIQKEDVIKKAFYELNLYNTNLNSSQSRMPNNCESIRVNCIGSVAAQAAVMHLGCAALDLTVIAGVICHGAAFTYQYTQGNNCNLEAQNCNKNNP